MFVKITVEQHDYLRTIIGMDSRIKFDRVLHSGSHGGSFEDPDLKLVDGILVALKEAQLDDLMQACQLEIDLERGEGDSKGNGET